MSGAGIAFIRIMTKIIYVVGLLLFSVNAFGMPDFAGLYRCESYGVSAGQVELKADNRSPVLKIVNDSGKKFALSELTCDNETVDSAAFIYSFCDESKISNYYREGSNSTQLSIKRVGERTIAINSSAERASIFGVRRIETALTCEKID